MFQRLNARASDIPNARRRFCPQKYHQLCLCTPLAHTRYSQFHPTDPDASSVLAYRVADVINNPITEVRVVGHIDSGSVKVSPTVFLRAQRLGCASASDPEVRRFNRCLLCLRRLGSACSACSLGAWARLAARAFDSVSVSLGKTPLIFSGIMKTSLQALFTKQATSIA